MPFAFSAVGEPYQVVFATIQQQSPSGVMGDYWDAVNGVWAAAPATNNRKITLVVGTGQNVGSWTGGTGKLGTYSGLVIVRIHDSNQSDYVVGQKPYLISLGDQVYPASTSDTAAIPLQTWGTINAQGGVLASNMRGTDGALTAAGYTAPNNAGITAAASDAASSKTFAQAAAADAASAKTAAQSADGKLPSDTTTKLGRLDVAVSSRSNLVATDVRADINANGGVLSSNMRGTDGALTAGAYVAPNNAGITSAAADASSARTNIDTLMTRITAPRAGYWDNLNTGGLVATQSTVNAISNTVRAKLITPSQVIIPASGSATYEIELLLYDSNGNMEDPDANPVFTAANVSGTDRSSAIGAVAKVSVGRYKVVYTVPSTAAAEQVVVAASMSENSLPIVAVGTMVLAPEGVSGGGAGSFLSTDRTKLDTIFGKLPSKAYLAGTALSDGDIDLAEMVGDRTPFKADVSTLSTAAQVTALQAYGDTNWHTATGFLTSGDTRLNNLDATISSRSTFNPGFVVASAADISALQAWGNAHWSTATGFLTANDARLNNLDATISSRSTFNVSTQSVTLAGGHGLAMATTVNAIKARTDLIPNQPAATTDIPTAVQISTQVAAKITEDHGSGSYTQAGGDATLANQLQILSQLASVTPTPVSPASIDDARTWKLKTTGEGAVAGNIVTITTSEVVDLAMSFRSRLNPGSTITLVQQVTVLEGDALTTTGLLPSGDRTAAHFRVSTAAAGLRRIQVTVTTSDGQTLTGRGFLEVVGNG